MPSTPIQENREECEACNTQGSFGIVNKEDHTCTKVTNSLDSYDSPSERQLDWIERFDKDFVVKSNAGTDLLRYTDANKIKLFIKNIIQRTREETTRELDKKVTNALWNEDGGLKSHDISYIVSTVMHQFLSDTITKE